MQLFPVKKRTTFAPLMLRRISESDVNAFTEPTVPLLIYWRICNPPERESPKAMPPFALCRSGKIFG